MKLWRLFVCMLAASPLVAAGDEAIDDFPRSLAPAEARAAHHALEDRDPLAVHFPCALLVAEQCPHAAITSSEAMRCKRTSL